jgi:hypothetical protein
MFALGTPANFQETCPVLRTSGYTQYAPTSKNPVGPTPMLERAAAVDDSTPLWGAVHFDHDL